MYAKVCPEPCGKHFQAQRSNRVYCSDRCRKRAHDRPSVPTPSGNESSSSRGIGVVEATLAALGDASGTQLGALALALAREIDGDGEGFQTGSAVAALSRELRSVMADAMASVKQPADPVEAVRGRGVAPRNGAAFLRIVP